VKYRLIMTYSRKMITLSGLMALLISSLAPFAPLSATARAQAETTPLTWTHLSTATGDLPLPSASLEQTSALILDIDRDNVNDFVIASRRNPGPAMVWYRRNDNGWTRYLIEGAALNIEAGGAFYDIDGDGDLDIVMGADSASNHVWWWENPYPDYAPDASWTRRIIKESDGSQQHDQIFGDFDNDGQTELVFWNQNARTLFLADIPADPHTTQPWPITPIYTWENGEAHEGLASTDIDADGVLDIVGAGLWFKYNGGTDFTGNVIDDAQRFSRSVAGQFIPGGWAEVVIAPGDNDGPIRLYQWDGSAWVGKDLLDHDIIHGHSLVADDLNQDGFLDIFSAEMRLNGDNPNAKMRIFLGDGAGDFTETIVATGYGNHQSQVGDLDGDGDLDILGKPFNWETPRLDIWLNEGTETCAKLDKWQRHVIDNSRPWRALFIDDADIDGDGLQDIVTGGWWYKNPGRMDDPWTRTAIGEGLNNMAAVYDFDQDGDADILGTGGQGSESNSTFVWAENDGAGSFVMHDNIDQADGTFLQGVAVDHFDTGNSLQVALSWHHSNQGNQLFTLPDDPRVDVWTWRQLSPFSQYEDLSAGDIDGDGRSDLLLGAYWQRYDGAGWRSHELHETVDEPDRNELADIDGDGRLDAVVGFEPSTSIHAALIWYAQPVTPTETWREHLITNLVGPMSLDVRDMDDDGDPDVVVGEHNLANPDRARLLIYENADGAGNQWREHLVHIGDEHHEGARLADMDGDGDLDILSIGWGHEQVLLYENLAPSHCGPVDRPPIILEQPENASVLVGESAVFTVTAEGTGPLTYQWQRNGQDIAGANNASLTLESLTLDDDGIQFHCIVSNALGSVISNAATLYVTAPDEPPRILEQPQDVAAMPGASASFSVKVQGMKPLAYQWQRNGNNIMGETGAIIQLDNLTTDDDGARFRCIVSNALGSVTSDNAVLYVKSIQHWSYLPLIGR
jgi:hypothetical protein